MYTVDYILVNALKSSKMLEGARSAKLMGTMMGNASALYVVSQVLAIFPPSF